MSWDFVHEMPTKIKKMFSFTEEEEEDEIDWFINHCPESMDSKGVFQDDFRSIVHHSSPASHALKLEVYEWPRLCYCCTSNPETKAAKWELVIDIIMWLLWKPLFFHHLIRKVKFWSILGFIIHKVNYFKPFLKKLNLEDYSWEVMKLKNLISQNIRILHKTNKRFIMQNCTRIVFSFVHLILGRRSLWRYGGESRWLRQQPSVLLGLVSLIILLTASHTLRFRLGKLAGPSSTMLPWSANQLLEVLALNTGAKSC